MESLILFLFGARETERSWSKGRRARAEGKSAFVHAVKGLLGLGAALLGAGALWHPCTVAGWICCAIAFAAGTHIPCVFPAINRVRTLWLLRNLFFIAMAVLCLTQAVRL